MPISTTLLFDVEADPAEAVDLAAEHPDIVAELKERLEEPMRHIDSLEATGNLKAAAWARYRVPRVSATGKPAYAFSIMPPKVTAAAAV